MEKQEDYIGTQFSDADYQDALKVDPHTGRQEMLEEQQRLAAAYSAQEAEKARLRLEAEKAEKQEFEDFLKQKRESGTESHHTPTPKVSGAKESRNASDNKSETGKKHSG